MNAKEFSYIGVGRVYLGEAGDAMRPVGNVSELNFQPQEESQELRNHQVPGGGLNNSLSRITAVNMTMAIRDFVAENIALALRGEVSDVEAGSVTDEVHTAYKGGLIRIANIDPSSVSAEDDAQSAYVEGTDYEVTAAGIYILESGSIPDESDIHLDYSHGAQRVIEALVRSGREYIMAFDGVNEAQSGKPVVIDAWRVKFSPTEGMGVISDEFGTLNVTGRLLADAGKGAGLSQYMRVTQVEA